MRARAPPRPRGTLNVELRSALPEPREAPGIPGGAASSALAGGRAGRAGCGTLVRGVHKIGRSDLFHR
eukprot:gene21539-biopygen14698